MQSSLAATSHQQGSSTLNRPGIGRAHADATRSKSKTRKEERIPSKQLDTSQQQRPLISVEIANNLAFTDSSTATSRAPRALTEQPPSENYFTTATDSNSDSSVGSSFTDTKKDQTAIGANAKSSTRKREIMAQKLKETLKKGSRLSNGSKKLTTVPVNPVKRRKVDLNCKHQLRLKIKSQKTRIKELEEKLQAKDGANEKLKEQNEQQAQKFVVAQTEAMKLLRKGIVSAEPDNIVRSEFDSIMAKCKTWARACALDSFQTLDAGRLEQAVQLISIDSTKNEVFATEKALRALKIGKLSPTTALVSVLTRILCANTVERPFFFLGRTGNSVIKNGDVVDEHLGGVLNRVLSRSESKDKSSLWRAQTVQILDPGSCHNASKAGTARDLETKEMKSAVYARCVRVLEDKVGKVLCRKMGDKENQKRDSDLKDIFGKAGTLSSKLSAQNVGIQVLFYNGMKKFTKGLFTNGSDFMEPHHSMHCDDDDASWNGRPIDLVIQPLILAWGDGHGGGFDKFKIWSKAVVLVVTFSTAELQQLEEAGATKSSMKPTQSTTKKVKAKSKAVVGLDQGVGPATKDNQETTTSSGDAQRSVAGLQSMPATKSKRLKETVGQKGADTKTKDSTVTPPSQHLGGKNDSAPVPEPMNDALVSKAGKAIKDMTSHSNKILKPLRSGNKPAAARSDNTMVDTDNSKPVPTGKKRFAPAQEGPRTEEQPAKKNKTTASPDPANVLPATTSDDLAETVNESTKKPEASGAYEAHAHQPKPKPDIIVLSD